MRALPELCLPPPCAICCACPGDDEVVRRELALLMAPAVPELGEAMKEDDRLALAGANVMQPLAVHVGEFVADVESVRRALRPGPILGGLHGTDFYAVVGPMSGKFRTSLA